MGTVTLSMPAITTNNESDDTAVHQCHAPATGCRRAKKLESSTKIMPAISLTQLSVTSAAFRQREPIPKRYTCDGEDVSPDLAWRGVPQGTETFALITDDPDAPRGTFTHWVYYNIPGAPALRGG